ncbi:neurofilament light polypeptide-like [Gymnodraco acuticeps]|uniref:Neurofilament light polypeptide-like n=1 Tax=Gymnodraco acuticeps TaxID=8218 RepID=A0A6P8TCI3_GYMAC|nr:neurofilament light polypeptide-like [Gymnodraco acuticeps]
MAKRKSKKPQEQDSSIVLESPVSKPKESMNTSKESMNTSKESMNTSKESMNTSKESIYSSEESINSSNGSVNVSKASVNTSNGSFNSYSSPALLFIIVFTVGASIMGWFCVENQQRVEQLSETFTSMQKKITNLQRAVEITESSQTYTGCDVEERIFALEKAEVALATSEKLRYSELGSLNAELDTRIAELEQVTLSVTTLQAIFKNQSEEFEAVKESVAAGLSSSSALAENVAELTNAVASASSKVDEQDASLAFLNVQLKGQASDLNEMKELMHLHDAALHTSNQEVASIKENVKTKQVMHALALEEMLTSVQVILDEQFDTTTILRTSIMAQMQTFNGQLGNDPSWSVNLDEDELEAEELLATTAKDATEVQGKLEDVEDKEEGMQEEQPLGQEVESDITEEEEEEITQEDEFTEQELLEVVALEEDVFKNIFEEEESDDSNQEVSMDVNEEDG